MLFRDICKVLGYYLFGLAMALAVPWLLAGYYQFFADPAAHPQPHTTFSFFWSMVICLSASGLCFYLGKQSRGNLYRREGLVSVVLIWFLTPVFAGLPFYMSGTLEDPFHAYFEAASGFTTTGSTTMQAKRYHSDTGQELPIRVVIPGVHPTVYTFWGTIKPVRDPETGLPLFEGVEAVSKALLFWRNLTQWLGGMGIVVLFVAVLPALGVGGKVLFQAEVPGPIKGSLTPRIKETASHLWKIYTGLTVCEVILLMVTNQEIGLYDALTITFSTVSTGGFSTKNESIGYFQSALTDWVVIVFMILGSINFALYFFSLKGKIYRFFESEFLLFLMIVLLSGAFASWLIVGTDLILLNGAEKGLISFWESFRYGFFQMISAMTTTGFSTADYDLWPYAAQALMLLLMYVGGMSGSTAGGIKVARHIMLFKIGQYKVESLFRPQAIRRFQLGEREVDKEVALTVLVYFLLVVSIAAFSTYFFILDGIDPETSFSLVTTLINNIGIGFRMAAPTQSCAFLSDYALVLSSLLMIFGRLEFFAVLAIMVPAFWKQDK